MKKRIAYWDNLKFLMIVFVVMGHFILENNSGISSPAFKSIGTFIYLFHMPVFFFISGYFYKKQSALWNVLTYVLYAIVTKLVLFVGKLSIFFVADKVFHKTVDYNYVKISFIRFNDIVWFLIVLSAAELIVYVFDRLDTRVLLLIGLIVGLLIGYIDGIGGANVLGDYFAWYRILIMLPFFVVGKYFREIDLIETIRRHNKIRVTLGIFLALIFVVFWLNPWNITSISVLCSGRNSYEILSQNWHTSLVSAAFICRFGAVFRLVTYILSTFMIVSWIAIMPDLSIPLITKAGAKTIIIFMFHYLGLYVVNVMGFSSIVNTTLGKASFVLISIAWTLFLAVISLYIPDFVKKLVIRLKNRGEA